MKSPVCFRRPATLLFYAGACLLAGCNGKPADPRSEAPPAAVVQADTDVNLVPIDHPEQFPLVAATSHAAAPAIEAQAPSLLTSPAPFP